MCGNDEQSIVRCFVLLSFFIILDTFLDVIQMQFGVSDSYAGQKSEDCVIE